jgi:hypothetical protein
MVVKKKIMKRIAGEMGHRCGGVGGGMHGRKVAVVQMVLLLLPLTWTVSNSGIFSRWI